MQLIHARVMFFHADVLGPRKVSVAYVDYGNVEEVELFHVKKLSGTLIRRLPALASAVATVWINCIS